MDRSDTSRQLLDENNLDLASIDQVLSTARSVRRKLDFQRAIDPQVLYDCINVAVQAPTGLAGENWRFVVVTDTALKAQLAKLYTSTLMQLLAERGIPIKPTHQALVDRLHDIPAMIFVCAIGAPQADDLSNQIGFFGSILPAAWSLMLALRARGIGATWTSLLSAKQTQVAQLLQIPSDVTQTVMLPIAYRKGATLKPAQRVAAEQVTYWNTWPNPKPS